MANRIRECRKAKGLSQRELADILSISPSTIGMYEQGRRDPDTKTLLNLAKSLDVSVDYLIGASSLEMQFDVEGTAKGIAKNLINNPALMFSADCYTNDELDDLCNVMEKTVKHTLSKMLNQNKKHCD